jgi:glycosyltransferase involved in cell wall biosynthesis
MKKLTILCPVYNEEVCIPLFIEQVKKIEMQLSGRYVVDIFFSNNASTDSTLTVLKKNSEIYNNIFFFTLSKNFGYQNSLQFALKHITGDIFVIIDVDGEDPVVMILEFLDKYEKGYDIVYGKREDRVENYFIKNLRKLFYRILKIFSDDEIILDMAEFSLFTNEVRLSILDENNSFPFIRSAISRVGYNKVAVSYKRNKRISGKTNYNFLTMLKFAVAGILSATTFPLRLPIYIFPFWLFYVFYVIYNLSIDKRLDNWNLFLIVSIIFILTILIFSALYLARTYKNIMSRSSAYIIKNKSKIKQQD